MRAVAAGNSRMGTSYNNYHKFIMTGKISASGNINTLLNPDPNADISLEGKNYCYCNMFSGCSSLTQAPELPATTLANRCYLSMFSNCTSLTQASFPNLEKETVTTEVVKRQSTFVDAASDIETTCKDGILIINSTSV